MEFKFLINKDVQQSGEVAWSSPSNIALVKYWGKYANQIPANPSISFTLSSCKTTTKFIYEPSDKLELKVWMGATRMHSFEPKIHAFFDRIMDFCPYLSNLKMRIETHNTFPHSSGIASSASGLSALALCVMSIEKQLNKKITEDFFYHKASFLARLGSGSAARSVYPKMASWGLSHDVANSSDLYGSVFSKAHKVFDDYQDTILLIDEGEKVVSSTVGHQLMNNHPFAKERFKQAHNNLKQLLTILETGDLSAFVNLVESEALTLHAMMMSSNPYFLLMKPNTLQAIDLIWKYRKEHHSHICFTLDAGANVHILYPASEKTTVRQFIESKLSPLCQNGKVIHDRVGNGPEEL